MRYTRWKAAPAMMCAKRLCADRLCLIGDINPFVAILTDGE